MDSKLSRAVGILWDYMQCHQDIRDTDCMIILGSRDDRVAAYAALLTKSCRYGHIVISGGISHTQDLLATSWGKETEAAHFAEVFRRSGGEGEVYVEPEARNTGQNAAFSYELLTAKNITPISLLVVTKPYMEKRALATFQAQWPDKNAHIYVSSQATSFHKYCNDEQPSDVVINIMVGDMQRIIEYPKLGLQTTQPVPRQVMEAYELLKASGFTRHLIAD